MKKILTIVTLAVATTGAFAQGTLNWGNTAATLISAGGVAMPVAATSQFNFAVFFAPSTTVNGVGQSVALGSPLFSTVGQTNVNTTAAGRFATRNGIAETTGTLAPGSTVDFIIRGWSASAGATYAEALAFWNNGSPAADMYFGQSLVGNDFVLGGGPIGVSPLIGTGANSIQSGFNMALVPGVVPEPSSLVLAGLGAASLLAFRRRN